MFSAPKARNSAAGPPRQMNSSRKYVSDLTRTADLCNRSFDTAQALLRTASGAQFAGQQGLKNLRQTRLGIRETKVDDDNQRPFANIKKATTKSTEFFLMPLPKKEKISEKAQKELTPPQEMDSVIIDPMTKRGRNDIVLLGKVDFCIRMHKLYANFNALWSVFGKLIKIIEGKNRFEQTLLLRNTAGDGPVLKCIFYDFGDDVLSRSEVGDSLRVVGRFLSENRFHVYKVEKSTLKKSTEDFSRIQNVISFVLLQKHSQETEGY